MHGETRKALNVLLAHERYDAPGELFDDRQTHRMRLLDAEAMAGQHVYERLNTVAAGLVARPEHMPGVALAHERWRGGPIVVRRPELYVDPRRSPSELPLHLTPDPELYRVFEGDLDALTHHLDRLVAYGLKRIQRVRRGRPALGAKAVRRIHPWSEPRTLRETRGRPVRTFKVGARDILGLEREVAASGERSGWRGEHRETRIARRDGDLTRSYPHGTYAARVHQGAPVEAEPPPDAVLAKPGPTLEDVQEELRTASPAEREERAAARRRLTDEVKHAWDEEVEAVVEHDGLELCRKVPVEAGDTVAGTVEVRHLSDRRPSERSSAARIVTLRDKRRGRPRRNGGAEGSDPPG